MKRLFRRWWFYTLLGCALILGVLTAKRVASIARAGEARKQPSDPIPVIAARVATGPFSRAVLAEGTARAVRREVLWFEIAGRVAAIGEDEAGKELREGSVVRGPSPEADNGQLLLRLHDADQADTVTLLVAELRQARSEIAAREAGLAHARSARNLAETHGQRVAALYAKQVTSRSQLDESEAELAASEAAVNAAAADLSRARALVDAITARLSIARRDLERTRMHAPFDGVIARLDARVGDHMGGDASPVLLVDPSAFEVVIELPFQDARMVSEGQSVRLTPLAVASGSGNPSSVREGPGVVYSVAPAVSLDTRMVRVTVRTTGPCPALKDGERVNVWTKAQPQASAVQVARDALLYRDGTPSVYVVDPESGTTEERFPTLGADGAGSVEVLAGLRGGDLVVTEGRHRLSPGRMVRVIRVEGEA